MHLITHTDGLPKSQTSQSISKKSLLVAGFSTLIEWYDFTLYLYFATVLSRVFFGEGAASMLITLAGFAVSYLMRPMGALVFGHIGDKYGRKTTLMISMFLMTLSMFLTAILPIQAQWGTMAGVLMVLLRCVMAFSVGAEYTGVVAYLLEGSLGRRGLLTSLASAASEVGALFAVLVCSLTVYLVPDGSLEMWGWRIPFVIGGVMALGVWLLRSDMDESPKFLAAQKSKTVAKTPLKYTFTHHKVGIFNSFMVSALGSITYYVGIVYVPIFLNDAGNLPESTALWLSTLAAVSVIAITPLVGYLSDKVGRRPVLITVAVLSLFVPIVTFALMASGSVFYALIGAVMLAFLAGSVSAVGASATAEQFPTKARLSGLALGTTMATAIFGGFTPLIAQYLLQTTKWALTPALMIALVAAMVLPVFWRLKETAFCDFD